MSEKVPEVPRLLPHAVAKDIDSRISLDDRASALVLQIVTELARLATAEPPVKREASGVDGDDATP